LIKIGFIVNPIAGMGGAVGLKGTDGNIYIEALKRGAKPVAPERAHRFMKTLNTYMKGKNSDLFILTPPNIMGEDHVVDTDLNYRILEINISKPTTADDTKRCARKLCELGTDLIVFVGGDGTARDIISVLRDTTPILGVPSGVKMYSAVFAPSPEAAAYIVSKFIEGSTELVDAEVLDIDEEAFRKNILSVKLYGVAKTITISRFYIGSKVVVSASEEEKIAIAKTIAEEWGNDTLYIVGPGSTTRAVTQLLGLPKTLLGIDIYLGTKVIALDVNEKKLLEIVPKYPKKKLIISPIGGQGFVLGRGNQQISPKVLRYISKEDIIIVVLPSKLRITKVFWVDTGDPEVDKQLEGFYKAVTGYREYTMIKILAASHIQ